MGDWEEKGGEENRTSFVFDQERSTKTGRVSTRANEWNRQALDPPGLPQGKEEKDEEDSVKKERRQGRRKACWTCLVSTQRE